MKITINNVEWDFNFVPSVCLPSNYYGQCCDEELTINVLKNMNPTRKRFTIIHELIHAIFHSQGRRYTWKDMDEESICEFIAWNLDTINNLVDYIQKHSDDENTK